MKKIHRNKVVLGTANLASNYGLNNSNILKKKNTKKFFDFLKKEKIRYLDTAFEYKNNEKILKTINTNNFKIINKIFIDKTNLTKEKIFNKIKISLKNLKLKSFYCVMLHNTDFLKNNNNSKIFEILKELKKAKLTKKIGYSIYDKRELDTFYKYFKPDIIQGPLNVFNQELLQSGWLKKLKKDKVEFHARSIFLQGLLLKKRGELPPYFKSYIRHFDRYYAFLKKNKISEISLCLNFIYHLKFVDKLVIGIDSERDLNEILTSKISNKINAKKLYILNTKSKAIKDPRLWPKKF